MVAVARNVLKESPLREARVQLHKTIADCAYASHVHWQLWYLVEVGCYETIPSCINDFLIKAGLEKINFQDYLEYRKSKQKDFGQEHGFSEYGSNLPSVNIHCSPIKQMWEAFGISRTAFAKALAIQPAHLYRLENGKAREIPNSVQTALLVAGLPVDVVEELNERQIEFYEARN